MYSATKYVLIAVSISLIAAVCFAQSTAPEAQPAPQAQSAAPETQPASPAAQAAPAGTQAPPTGVQPTPGVQTTPAPQPEPGTQATAEVRPAPAEAQSAPTEADKMASISKVADRFIERLHQTLDVSALSDMFAADIGSRYRDYPGEFLPFSTPRMAKTLLKDSDDNTLRRKLMADWNLAYLTSVLLKAAASNADPAKVLPPEFVKLAKKSNYLKPMIGTAGQITLVSPSELNEYLAEADQMIPVLRRNVKPETLTAAFRTVAQGTRTPTMVPYGMGYDAVYTVARESLLLVVADNGRGEFKIVSLAAPSAN